MEKVIPTWFTASLEFNIWNGIIVILPILFFNNFVEINETYFHIEKYFVNIKLRENIFAANYIYRILQPNIFNIVKGWLDKNIKKIGAKFTG